jgi:hypothetical protein
MVVGVGHRVQNARLTTAPSKSQQYQLDDSWGEYTAPTKHIGILSTSKDPATGLAGEANGHVKSKTLNVTPATEDM